MQRQKNTCLMAALPPRKFFPSGKFFRIAMKSIIKNMQKMHIFLDGLETVSFTTHMFAICIINRKPALNKEGPWNKQLKLAPKMTNISLVYQRNFNKSNNWC